MQRWNQALANAPALVDVVLTQDALSSDAGKGLGWVPDYQALTAWDDANGAVAAKSWPEDATDIDITLS